MANFNFPFNFAPGVTVTITTTDGANNTGELVKLEDGYVVLNVAGTITLINLAQITAVVPA